MADTRLGSDAVPRISESCPAAGFEQGPIRPPSEAASLLLRVTRNCPWNRCRFCHIYRGSSFSARGVDEIRVEIDGLKTSVDRLVSCSRDLGFDGSINTRVISAALAGDDSRDRECDRVAASWLFHGARTVFLQDANSLVVPVDQLSEILIHLRKTFPSISRVTTYARSHTLARMGTERLRKLKTAGLDRVHVGMESGHDPLLEFMNKGVTVEQHVTGGRNVMNAGLELSEYVMPGLGGESWWREHAVHTAAALVRIAPHFIRLRTTVLHPNLDLSGDASAGSWKPLDDDGIIREILLLLERLEGCEGSTLVSDHIINLLPMIAGRLPEDRLAMMNVAEEYLALPDEARLLFRIGRRGGIFTAIEDLEDATFHARAERLRAALEDRFTDAETGLRQLITGFI